MATIRSAAVTATSGHPVAVEVHVTPGLPGFTVVGAPDAECRQFRDRVRAAILSSGFDWPMNRITVDISDGDRRKGTRGMDLPAAVGILAASQQVPLGSPERSVGLVGDLSLDGSVRPVHGALPLAEALDTDDVVVPASDAAAAAAVAGDRVRPATTLRGVCDALAGNAPWPQLPAGTPRRDAGPARDLADIKGQHDALRAMEVAAAGGHNLLLVGSPGSGKAMLATRMQGLLPDLSDDESLEVSRVHSAAGLPLPDGLITRPPMRAPHHTASTPALLGGGGAHARPGEISCASGGVLWLDDVVEFAPSALDALTTPMSEGHVTVARPPRGTVRLPARFQLVASMNRCRCGSQDPSECRCSAGSLSRYAKRLSGPFVDRIEIAVNVQPASVDDTPSRTTAEVAERVAAARELARSRGVRCNHDLRNDQLEEHAALDRASDTILHDALREGRLTARGIRTVRTVARTIRDLDGGGDIEPSDIQEALALRSTAATPATPRDERSSDDGQPPAEPEPVPELHGGIHQAPEPPSPKMPPGVAAPLPRDLCGKKVKATGRRCLLLSSHRGRCRSVLR